jgi:uncharacterized Zn finger protein
VSQTTRPDYSCPQCSGDGKPINVKAEAGAITVTIECRACGHQWTIARRREHFDKTTA